jgi:hypothetical protein
MFVFNEQFIKLFSIVIRECLCRTRMVRRFLHDKSTALFMKLLLLLFPSRSSNSHLSLAQNARGGYVTGTGNGLIMKYDDSYS